MYVLWTIPPKLSFVSSNLNYNMFCTSRNIFMQAENIFLKNELWLFAKSLCLICVEIESTQILKDFLIPFWFVKVLHFKEKNYVTAGVSSFHGVDNCSWTEQVLSERHIEIPPCLPLSSSRHNILFVRIQNACL